MANQNLLPAGDNPKYNNCFTLGEKCWHNGRLIKVPVFIDHYDDTIQNLYGSKNGDKRKYYELSYEEARTEYYRFRSSENWEKSSKVLRISLWLDNAMFGNLHIFVIDFDKIDGTVETESVFFKEAKELADTVGADGAVLFAHWGCKNTIGASSLIKRSLEREGLPTMVLDGDGCNPANASDGQISTRLQAFVEMLTEQERNQK